MLYEVKYACEFFLKMYVTNMYSFICINYCYQIQELFLIIKNELTYILFKVHSHYY